jgi:hypothetical protein
LNIELLSSTGVLADEFVKHESFFAYAGLCKYYFREIGVPVAFYSDKLENMLNVFMNRPSFIGYEKVGITSSANICIWSFNSCTLSAQ